MLINLLPEKQKKELELEEKQKKALLVLFYFIFSLIFFAFLLFFTNHYITERVISLGDEVLAKNEELQGAKIQESKQIISDINQKLSKIDTVFEERVMLSGFLEKIASLTPSSVYFTTFSLQRQLRKTEQGETEFFFEVTIQGVAETREELYSFKQIVDKEETLQDPYFQPFSWVSPVKADFTLDLIYLPK